jgi:hypothetical protein
MPAAGANLQVNAMMLAATRQKLILYSNGGNGGSMPATVPVPGADPAMGELVADHP